MIPYMKLFPRLKKAEYDAVWEKIDKNHDGELSFEELSAHYGFKLSPSGSRKGGSAAEMTDEQILEALQMQAALADLQTEREAKKDKSPAVVPQGRRASSGTGNRVNSRGNTSGVQTIKMPQKTSLQDPGVSVRFLQACELGGSDEVLSLLKKVDNVMIE